jgi:hypothetical protein
MKIINKIKGLWRFHVKTLSILAIERFHVDRSISIERGYTWTFPANHLRQNNLNVILRRSRSPFDSAQGFVLSVIEGRRISMRLIRQRRM